MSWERNPTPIVLRKALVRHDDDFLQAALTGSLDRWTASRAAGVLGIPCTKSVP